jgi:membrane-bound serine protease (ClpP class)
VHLVWKMTWRLALGKMTWRLALTAAMLALVAPVVQSETPGAEPRCVVRAQVDGVINTGTASYLEDALAATGERGCEALLVILDTPGGSLSATRRIVRALLGAPVPVVVYVAPSGARAGSAGAFVTMAAHVAAMAPATTIGAAHPVVGLGQDPEASGGEHLGRKIENDTAALARAIAQRRGRNLEWAERAVRESVSATASEALELGVVDLLAGSADELLLRLDGRIIAGAGDRPLQTAGATIQDVEMTLQQRVLSFVADPTVAYLLAMLGMIGLLLELYNPGMIVPGVIGAISLLIAALGFEVLPVQATAVVLLVIAVLLLAAELFVTSYGLLALGGLAALLLGGSLFIDRSSQDFFADAGLGLSWGAVIPLAIVVAMAAAGLAWRGRALRGGRSPTGREGMIGKQGAAIHAFGPEGGTIMLDGERWHAVSRGRVGAGMPVRVIRVDGLTVEVEPTSEQGGH